jgi:hypothetical protein
LSSLAIAEFFKVNASSIVFPLISSVANELLAMAEPQPDKHISPFCKEKSIVYLPKVLKQALVITLFSSTSICSFITSPQAGAPTRPVPTRGSDLLREPTFLGRS